jgi:transcriptional regulator with XRE-family HTH domain
MKGGITMSSTFHERVTAVVKESKLNQTEFATRIGISQQYLSQICNGKKNPSDRTISDICREFRVNEKWIRTGEEPMYLPEPDDDSAYLDELLSDLDNPFYDIIKEILKTYMEATPAEQDALNAFVRRLKENKEGRD